MKYSLSNFWHRYDMSYGALVGMTYHLKPWPAIGKLKTLEG